MELKKKLFALVSKPYQVFAKEEANEDYALLKAHYTELEEEAHNLRMQLQSQVSVQAIEQHQNSV